MELIGSRFGHIRIVDILGQGGMGDVYAGYDETLQRRVALKAIRPEQRLDAEARGRLIREARTLSQLEHPNICRIYEYIEGTEVDLLVLELIEGKTLEVALRDGLPAPEQLRIADAIARVLVAAHRAGIIHRDLKPENVMLTPSGEVKVLDFGLARWAEKQQSSGAESAITPAESFRAQLRVAPQQIDSDGQPIDETSTVIVPTVPALPAPEKRRDRAVLATAAGVTMGTPLYMSPEQARGETLTPASDMYSFGLVMQTLFTGREPYDNTMTGREVMVAASRGESLPAIGANRDITALINRLKQLAPTDRPTAVETLDRLRWMADRPKRLARRLTAAAVMLVVLLATWKYVTDLRRERAAAVAAETEARARRAQAEDLISFMLGDLRTKLEPVGRLDILDNVAEKALKYTNSMDVDRVSIDELTRTSKALNQLGDVRIGQGNLPAAIPVFDRSIALAQKAVQRDPASDEAQFALGTSHFWVGKAYLLQGDLPSALLHMRAYLDSSTALHRRHPEDERYSLEYAYGHSVVATVLEDQGALDDALKHYQETLAIKRARVLRVPDDAQRQGDLAVTINKIGFVRARLGDLIGARDQFETELQIRQRLVSREPENTRWQRGLATSHSYAGGVADMLGDTDGAIKHWTVERDIEAGLATRDPENIAWRRDLAATQMRIADLMRGKGDVRAALIIFDEAERMLATAVAKDPKRTSWARDLAVLRSRKARALLRSGRVEEARRYAEEGVTALTAMPKSEGAARMRLLCEALLVSGDAYAASGDVGRGRAAWQRAADVIEPIAAASSDPQVCDLWARSLIHLGRSDEARHVVQKLRSTGYRNRDLESLCGTNNC